MSFHNLRGRSYQWLKVSLIAITWISIIVGGVAVVNFWLNPKNSGSLSGPAKFIVKGIPGGIDISGRCELHVTDGVSTIKVWYSVYPPIRQVKNTVVFIGQVAPSYPGASEERILAVRWPGPVKDITLQVARVAAEARRSIKSYGEIKEHYPIFSGIYGLKQSSDSRNIWMVQFWLSDIPDHELGVAMFGPEDVERWIDESTIALSSYKDFRPLQPLTAGNINK